MALLTCVYKGDENYLLNNVHITYKVWALLATSKATTASKQPRRANMASDLKSMTPNTYLSMSILLILYGHLWQPLRPLQPPNSLRSDPTSDLKSVTSVTYVT